MKKVGIFFASAMGNTETAAIDIQNTFGHEQADVIPVTDADVSTINQYENLIIGGSTWGAGEVQDDMEDFFEILAQADLKEKKIALFGLGDQEAYPFAFADSLGKLYDKIASFSQNIVGGKQSPEGYKFDSSKALQENGFVGLVLDVDTQPELTEERINKWVEELKETFK